MNRRAPSGCTPFLFAGIILSAIHSLSLGAMKKLFVLIILLSISTEMFAWGALGHRIIGLIAERHLSKKARKNVELVLGTETLAEVSNYMDFIRSDNAYGHMAPWHYATIPDGQTYEEAGVPKAGDAIQTINRLIDELNSKEFTDRDEAFALKCLVHLVGDNPSTIACWKW